MQNKLTIIIATTCLVISTAQARGGEGKRGGRGHRSPIQLVRLHAAELGIDAATVQAIETELQSSRTRMQQARQALAQAVQTFGKESAQAQQARQAVRMQRRAMWQQIKPRLNEEQLKVLRFKMLRKRPRLYKNIARHAEQLGVDPATVRVIESIALTSRDRLKQLRMELARVQQQNGPRSAQAQQVRQALRLQRRAASAEIKRYLTEEQWRSLKQLKHRHRSGRAAPATVTGA